MLDNFWTNHNDAIVSKPRPGVAAHWNGDNEVTIRVARIRDGVVDEELVSIPPEALKPLAQKLLALAEEQKG